MDALGTADPETAERLAREELDRPLPGVVAAGQYLDAIQTVARKERVLRLARRFAIARVASGAVQDAPAEHIRVAEEFIAAEDAYTAEGPGLDSPLVEAALRRARSTIHGGS